MISTWRHQLFLWYHFKRFDRCRTRVFQKRHEQFHYFALDLFGPLFLIPTDHPLYLLRKLSRKYLNKKLIDEFRCQQNQGERHLADLFEISCSRVVHRFHLTFDVPKRRHDWFWWVGRGTRATKITTWVGRNETQTTTQYRRGGVRFENFNNNPEILSVSTILWSGCSSFFW